MVILIDSNEYKTTYDLELSKNMEVYKIAFVGCTYHCG
jgi:hypothetical protein